MIHNVELRKILVIDIETVPQHSSYDLMTDTWKKFWDKKMIKELKDDNSIQELYHRAGIYAEFGKIVCICAGVFYFDSNILSFKVKAFYNDDEKKLLMEFNDLITTNFNTDDYYLCGHNSKEFDFPYIARRCLANGLVIPQKLNTAVVKPWDIRSLDTMDYWKFGDYKSSTSLNLLAAIFGIDSPKDDIDGSQVWSTYWIDKDLERIKNYCMKDVVTTAQIILKFKGMELLKPENISFTN